VNQELKISLKTHTVILSAAKDFARANGFFGKAL
jgi:hypothetical protein